LVQRRLVFDAVPFENDDRIEVIGEHPCRHQARQATADDDGLSAEVIRHTYPSSDGMRRRASYADV
jgi:hypothetical protein